MSDEITHQDRLRGALFSGGRAPVKPHLVTGAVYPIG
jgi:hypothetical protein